MVCSSASTWHPRQCDVPLKSKGQDVPLKIGIHEGETSMFPSGDYGLNMAVGGSNENGQCFYGLNLLEIQKFFRTHYRNAPKGI